MKKILSIALAVIMVFSLSVMAFAAEGTWYEDDVQVDAADAATDLKTATYAIDDEGQQVDPTNYTITIPASVTIPWGGTPAAVGADEFTWSYKTQLYAGDTLEVGIADADRTGSFAGADTLTYTLSGEMEAVAGDLAESTQTVAVDVQGWDNVPIDEYTATVTFEATYVAA